MKAALTIGTRGSALALWQAHFVRDVLKKKFPSLLIELKIIKTTGDKILDAPLSKIGDKGLFTKEIENALLDGRIDVAVHSLKDVPTHIPVGLRIAAVAKREDVRDVLISSKWKSLDELPERATIATGSLRRKAQLLHHRPDLRIVDIRGNLQTRFARYEESNWDGMMLAYAGVKRLGLEKHIAQIIPTELILPAVGQGALGIEIRSDDDRTLRFIKILNHPATETCTRAERSLLRTLEGGCQIPIGAHAAMKKGKLVLRAVVGSIDGSVLLDVDGSSMPSRAEQLGIRLGEKLLRNGAKEILESIRRHG